MKRILVHKFVIIITPLLLFSGCFSSSEESESKSAVGVAAIDMESVFRAFGGQRKLSDYLQQNANALLEQREALRAELQSILDEQVENRESDPDEVDDQSLANTLLLR